MEKKILIFILLLIGNGIVNAVEYPFVPSGNEHFVVEDYESEIVGSPEQPVPVDPPEKPNEVNKPNGFLYILALLGNQDAINVINAYQEYLTELGIYNDDYSEWSNSESGEDWNRMQNDPNWPSYVDPEYWEEFLNNYPEYYDEVYEYYQNNPTVDNNPFRLSLLDDTAGILILLIGGIAYLIYKFKLKEK